MLARVTIACFLFSYLLAFAFELLRLYWRHWIPRALMVTLAAAGLFAQTIYLFERSRATGLPPLLSSAHDWVLVLAWLLVLTFLLLAASNKDLATGLLLLPMVILLVLATVFTHDLPNVTTEAHRAEVIRVSHRGWAMLHASSLVLGMAAVAAAIIAAIMYLIQHWRVRTHNRLRTRFQLPSLEKLGQANWWSVVLAFVMLTVGWGTGVVLGLFSRPSLVSVRFLEPVVIASAGLWVVLAGVMVWHASHRPVSGRQVAWLTIFACGLLLVTLVGLQISRGGLGVHSSQNASSTTGRQLASATAGGIESR